MSNDFVKRILETCFITVGAFGTHAEVLTACCRHTGTAVSGERVKLYTGKTGVRGTEKASWGEGVPFSLKTY